MADAVKASKRRKKKNAPEALDEQLLEQNLEDLEDGEPEDGKKRRKKKKPKVKKEKAEKKGGFGAALLAILVVLIVVAGVFLYLTIVNDWGGVRTSLLTTVNKLDPNFRTLEEQKVAEYNAAKAQLESDQAKLLKDQQALEQRKADLDLRQAAISNAEAELLPIYRRNLSEEKLEEIRQTGKIYESMEPATAAGIMSRLYDETYIAAILYYMKPAAAADVMSHMTAELAARVTTELLKN